MFLVTLSKRICRHQSSAFFKIIIAICIILIVTVLPSIIQDYMYTQTEESNTQPKPRFANVYHEQPVKEVVILDKKSGNHGNHTTPPPVLILRLDNDNREPYIFIGGYGRFANHLFAYASVYGIGRATGHIPAMTEGALSALETYFKGVHAMEKSIPSGYKIQVIQEKKAAGYNVEVYPDKDNDVEICCFLQSWKYFYKYEADLKQHLQFHDDIVRDTHKIIHTLVDKQRKEMSARKDFSGKVSNSTGYRGNDTGKLTNTFTVIGVHVRRQDFAQVAQIKRGYKPAPQSYFLKAMDYYRKLYRDTLFLVCSDDLVWSRANLNITISGSPAADVQFVPSMLITDFPMLTYSNHTIISVGSFGWWASWLSNGTVVYYNNWPIADTEIGDQYEKNDYFPPHWVGLGD